ncbi:MAG TPA: Hsp20/alpha crystallin family protein [Spirochaetota bacterium]|nr:Hsp20/alpha crystallin family protein [Spirochaetota bacterium]
MTTEVKKLKTDAYHCNECVIVPAIDIYEDANEFVLTADMPGVAREDLEITMKDNTLTVDGKVSPAYLSAEDLKYREYTLYNFHRVFQVDDAVNAGRITAKLDNGVLVITLPKSEKAKPRKIEITVEK